MSKILGKIHFVVLVPHRDSRRPLRSWSLSLFAAGFWGAWSFPQAAPLALLSRPLSAVELKDLAHVLRDLTTAEGRDGKLRPGPAEALPLGGALSSGGLPPDFAIYGPALDITLSSECFSPTAGAKIIEVFPRPLLGCAVLNAPQSSPAEGAPASAPPLPEISFRAAAVANMVYRPLPAGENGYSFSWKIGELYWLPKGEK